MISAKFYYPRLDASFIISANDYTDIVRVLGEFRNCVVESIFECESEEYEDED